MSIGLLLSILIRLAALVWSLVLLRRLRDWRMGFLSVMLALMALRQFLTLTSKSTSWELSFSSLDTEWPGIIVSIMAFLAVYFVGQMLEERRQTALQQSALIEKLEKQNAELERFSYTISHDLKTPLVTITGFLGYLQRDADAGNTSGMKQNIEKISSAAKRMAQILDELLELARVGRVVNPFESVATTEIVGDAMQQVDVQLDNRKVSVRVASNMPTVFADKERLREVFVILLDNATKFIGDQSSPVVEIDCTQTDREYVFRVADNGLGIEPRYLDQIFSLFERLDARIEGTGVGLALARRIIEMHQGRIWAESEGPGKGSTFRFALPV